MVRAKLSEYRVDVRCRLKPAANFQWPGLSPWFMQVYPRYYVCLEAAGSWAYPLPLSQILAELSSGLKELPCLSGSTMPRE